MESEIFLFLILNVLDFSPIINHNILLIGIYSLFASDVLSLNKPDRVQLDTSSNPNESSASIHIFNQLSSYTSKCCAFYLRIYLSVYSYFSAMVPSAVSSPSSLWKTLWLALRLLKRALCTILQVRIFVQGLSISCKSWCTCSQSKCSEIPWRGSSSFCAHTSGWTGLSWSMSTCSWGSRIWSCRSGAWRTSCYGMITRRSKQGVACLWRNALVVMDAHIDGA